MKATIKATKRYSSISFDESLELKPLVDYLNRKCDGSWDFSALWDECILESEWPEAVAFFHSAARSELGLSHNDIELDGDAARLREEYKDAASRANRSFSLE